MEKTQMTLAKKSKAAAKKSVKQETTPEQEIIEELKPKPPTKLCSRGIRNFTVCRQEDETNVSGIGIVIEGTVYASGQTVVHWLYPSPRGSIAIFDSMNDFIEVHIKPHPNNKTVITFEDGSQVSDF